MIDVVMPQMGESIVEGTLTRWLKKPGERVERDEPLFEISTDKVDTEIPSPAAGVLKDVLVEEGKTVAINTIVARIEDGGAAGATAAATESAAPQAATETSAAAEQKEQAKTPSPPERVRILPFPSRSPQRRPQWKSRADRCLPLFGRWLVSTTSICARSAERAQVGELRNPTLTSI